MGRQMTFILGIVLLLFTVAIKTLDAAPVSDGMNDFDLPLGNEWNVTWDLDFLLGNEGNVTWELDSRDGDERPDFRRTVILIEKMTLYGENLFIRGGTNKNQREGCYKNFWEVSEGPSPCAIPIVHRRLQIDQMTPARNSWAHGHNFLDWGGAEEGQGWWHGERALGGPAQWTTNQPGVHYHHPINTFGPHYWLVDVQMDCSKTMKGFFEVEAVIKVNGGQHKREEGSVLWGGKCDGEAARDPPHRANYHFGQCGHLNVFHWGSSKCQVHELD